MNKLFLTLLLVFLGNTLPVLGQDSTGFHLSGYLDTYYSYYTDSLAPNDFQRFTTVAPRSERFGVNVAQLGAHYSGKHLRGNLVLHWGDIAEATWSPDYNMLQQANLGVHLGKGFWVDAGFFITHIGTEAFQPKGNFMSSTAVATFQEPFYQAGAKLSYEGSPKFHLELWALNGYNTFLDNNDAKSFGLLVTYNFSENTSLTYNNLFGRESPDGIPQKRYLTYHNINLSTKLGKAVEMVLGADFGSQSNSKLLDSTSPAFLYNVLAAFRYTFHPKWSISTRGEIYQDSEGLLSGVFPDVNQTVQGLQLFGVALNLEHRPIENSYIRFETRYLQTNKELQIFSGDITGNKRLEILLNMGFYFSKRLRFK